jgi:hypothetical protein
MLLIGNIMNAIKELKKHLSSKLDMKDISVERLIMGMEIKRDRVAINLWLNQKKYIEIIFKRFNMQDWKPLKVPIPVGARLIVEQCLGT